MWKQLKTTFSTLLKGIWALAAVYIILFALGNFLVGPMFTDIPYAERTGFDKYFIMPLFGLISSALIAFVLGVAYAIGEALS